MEGGDGGGQSGSGGGTWQRWPKVIGMEVELTAAKVAGGGG